MADEVMTEDERAEMLFRGQGWYERLAPPPPPQRFKPRPNVLIRRERVMEAFESAFKEQHFSDFEERRFRKDFVYGLDLMVQAIEGEKALNGLGKRNTRRKQ